MMKILKKINAIINILMCGFIGAFVGGAICKYLDYIKHPDLYVAQSAPWYLDIQISAVALALVLVVCIVVKIIIRNKERI